MNYTIFVQLVVNFLKRTKVLQEDCFFHGYCIMEILFIKKRTISGCKLQTILNLMFLNIQNKHNRVHGAE